MYYSFRAYFFYDFNKFYSKTFQLIESFNWKVCWNVARYLKFMCLQSVSYKFCIVKEGLENTIIYRIMDKKKKCVNKAIKYFCFQHSVLLRNYRYNLWYLWKLYFYAGLLYIIINVFNYYVDWSVIIKYNLCRHDRVGIKYLNHFFRITHNIIFVNKI